MKNFVNLILKCLKSLLQWFVNQIDMIDMVYIIYFILFILIFLLFPKIKFDTLLHTVDGMVMLGALFLAALLPVTETKRKAHKKEQEKKDESDNTSE